MNSYLEKLKLYISENQIDFDESVDFPCLEALWLHYREHHPLNSVKIMQGFRDLRGILSELHATTADDIISVTGCLCAEHERIAFIAGLQLGAQLMLELIEKHIGDAKSGQA